MFAEFVLSPLPVEERFALRAEAIAIPEWMERAAQLIAGCAIGSVIGGVSAVAINGIIAYAAALGAAAFITTTIWVLGLIVMFHTTLTVSQSFGKWCLGRKPIAYSRDALVGAVKCTARRLRGEKPSKA